MKQNSQFFSMLIERGQFRVDESGHALLFGEFLLLIPPEVVLELQRQLEDELGRDGMTALMQHIGAYQIDQAVERHDEQYNLDDISKEKLLDYFDRINNILGWGEIAFESIDTDDGTYEITVQQPMLPTVQRDRYEKTEQPICHYLAGMLNRQMEILIEDELSIEETDCAATGGKVCTFEGTATD